MTNLIHINDENFQEEVLNSKIPVIVDFSANWCGPCKILSPIMEELANEMAGKAKVCKIDIDESPSATGKLGIKGVPTVLTFNRGELSGTSVGLSSKEKIIKMIEPLLK
jgi:thioredoxin 1